MKMRNKVRILTMPSRLVEGARLTSTLVGIGGSSSPALLPTILPTMSSLSLWGRARHMGAVFQPAIKKGLQSVDSSRIFSSLKFFTSALLVSRRQGVLVLPPAAPPNLMEG